MKSAPEVIRDSVFETFAINSPEGYARIGERVVEALRAGGYTLQRCEEEPKLTSDEIAQFTTTYNAALAEDRSARQAFHSLNILTSRIHHCGLDRPLKHVLQAIENMEPGSKRTTTRSIFLSEDSGAHASNPARRKGLDEEADALMEEIIEGCIAKQDFEWSTDIEALKRERGPVVIQIHGEDNTYRAQVVGGGHMRLIGPIVSRFGFNLVRFWRRAV